MNLTVLAEAVGVTVVFTRGSIFERARENGPTLWRELAGCPLCAGVWIGAGWRALYGELPHDVLSAVRECLGAGALTGTIALAVSLGLSTLDKASD